jgi:hypothetical protein
MSWVQILTALAESVMLCLRKSGGTLFGVCGTRPPSSDIQYSDAMSDCSGLLQD